MGDEAAKVEELRARVGPLPDDMVVSGDQAAALRRFLVARKWDVDKAEEQLRRALVWRSEEFGVTAFLANPPLQRLAYVRTLLPSNPHLGFSKAGFPVSLLSLGSADLPAMARELAPADVIADFVVRAEFYRAVVFPEATARAGGKVVDKEVVVLDVGGVSLGMMKVMTLFKAVNTVGSTYFPERTVHILVLNAPRVFASLWSILQGLVDPRTQKKVCIMAGGEKQLQVLRTYMEDADIPQAYGGARAPPHTSNKDAQATAAIFARLDAWLAQCGTARAPADAQSAVVPPDVPARLSATDARCDRAAPQQQPARVSTPSCRKDETKLPPASPSGRVLTPQPSLSRSASKVQRESELADPEVAATDRRNKLLLLALWAASTLTFALLAWAHIAGLSELLRRKTT